VNTLEDRLQLALAAKSNEITRLVLDRPTPALDLDAEPEVLLPEPRHSEHRSRGLVAAALAVAAMVLLAVGATVAHRASTAHRFEPAQDRPRSAVPWSKVGADWTLIITLQGSARTNGGVLYLLDPSGHRFAIAPLPQGYLHLERWSFDTGEALVTGDTDPATNAGQALLVDLHTGVQSKLVVPGRYNTLQFAGRDHRLLLATSPQWMVAVTGTGQRLATFQGSQFAGSLVSPDGTQVVTGSAEGLQVYDLATARRIRTLAAPAGYRDCAVTYRDTASPDVVARCWSSTRSTLVTEFSFAPDGSRPPQRRSVPAGWTAVSFSGGTVAIAHDTSARYEPRNVRFAQVDRSGRLSPLTLPAQLQQQGWEIASVGTQSFLLERSEGGPPVELARWNPLDGAFVSLFQATGGRASLASYAGWKTDLF